MCSFPVTFGGGLHEQSNLIFEGNSDFKILQVIEVHSRLSLTGGPVAKHCVLLQCLKLLQLAALTSMLDGD